MSRKQTAYVVRHAIAENRESWSGPDAQRPLTPDGHGQTARLAAALGKEDIHRVLSSPAVRCVQTVAPLAAGLGLKVEHARGLLEGTAPEETFRFLTELTEPSAVACTHGDVIEGLLLLLARQGVLPEGPAKLKKASTWVLSIEDGVVRRARYLPPP